MAPVPEIVSSSVNRLTSYLFTRSSSSILQSRDTTFTPGTGVTAPTAIPNNAIFALFGIIGAGFVITGIWFFFWAKNGGFHFREGDWEDYKSTVLRRKGPNGTTLSGATRTTDLGGGSVVGKRYKDVESMSSIGTESEMSEIKAGRGGRKGRKPKSSKNKPTRTPHDEESLVGMEEQEPEAAIRAYRHEKPARVGGLNRMPDSSAFEGSTHDSHSDLLSNRERTPTTTPTKKIRKDNYTGGSGTPGIRKVDTVSGKGTGGGFWNKASTASNRESNATEDRIKSEARKLQEKGRQAASSASRGRRDFSYTAGDDAAAASPRHHSRSPRVPGSYAESDVGSDMTGTKSYHHPIPGLSEYAEERRKARAGAAAGGYRRGRRDELSDDE